MSETPIYDALAKKYELTNQYNLTDREIEGREEIVADDRIELFKEDVVRPEVFEVAEIDHEVIQPPTYEAPSNEELLRQSIEASPHLVLVKDISDVSVAVVGYRSRLAA